MRAPFMAMKYSLPSVVEEGEDGVHPPVQQRILSFLYPSEIP